MVKKWTKFLRDESGATAIEYALIAGIISLAIVSGATNVGGSLTNTYDNVGNQF